MVSQIRQSQKNKHCMIPLAVYKTSKVVKHLESSLVVTRGWGEGKTGVILQWVKGFSLHNEKVLEIGWTNVHIVNSIALYT